MLRLRNMRIRDWHPLVTAIWPRIVTLVYRDRIDVIT